MKIVRFALAAELIHQSLAMPPAAQIVDIRRDPDRIGTFIFYVTHPGLDEVRDGELIPETTPAIEANEQNRPGAWLTFHLQGLPDP